MAANYTCANFTGPDKKKYLILKTPASNIRLVRTYRAGAYRTVKDSGYYGMNASFFNSNSNLAILNIAVQNGNTAGTGQLVPRPDSGEITDGLVNLVGSSAITWNGSALSCINNVRYASDTRIPMSPHTWAQGGFGLYLCDDNWKGKFIGENSAKNYSLTSAAARTGILINKSTKYVYLFACTSEILISDLRAAMMSYAGLSGSSSAGSWAAIMTDGGHSTQLYSDEGSATIFAAREIPQIIALKYID